MLIPQGKKSPLWAASYEGRLDIVKSLLDQGAEVNLPTDVSAFQVHGGSNMVVRFVGKFVYFMCNLCGLCGMCISAVTYATTLLTHAG